MSTHRKLKVQRVGLLIVLCWSSLLSSCSDPGGALESPVQTTCRDTPLNGDCVLGAETHLKLWLKADSLTGLSNNDAVASWADSSVSALTAAQSDIAKQPKYVASSFNGKPAVKFSQVDRTSLTLADASIFPETLGDWDFFFVFKHTLYEVDYGTILGFGNSGDYPFFGLSNAAFDIYRLPVAGFGIREVFSNTFLEINQGYLIECYRTGDLAGFRNNQQDDGSARLVNANPLSITGVARYFGGDTGSESFDGEIAEVLLFDTYLSSAGRRSVETYLKAKYSL